MISPDCKAVFNLHEALGLWWKFCKFRLYLNYRLGNKSILQCYCSAISLVIVGTGNSNNRFLNKHAISHFENKTLSNIVIKLWVHH